MAIENILVHFNKKEDFLKLIQNITDSSIVFIKDTKEIYTHGLYYPCPYTEGELEDKFLSLEGGTMNTTDLIENLNAEMLGGYTADDFNSSIENINNSLQESNTYLQNQVESLENNKADIDDLSNVLGEEVLDELTFKEYDVVTREEIKKDLFIDMWNKAVGSYGTYNQETGFFELNGLTDIDYNEAILIYNTSPKGNIYELKNALSGIKYKVRTLLPATAASTTYNVLENTYTYNINLVSIRLPVYYSDGRCKVNNLNATFLGDKNLERILTPIELRSSTELTRSFEQCGKLKIVYLYGVKGNVNFSSNVSLLLESFQYLIENAENIVPITITVYQNIYNALSGEAEYPFNGGSREEWLQLNEDAISKQITFATNE